jgi:isochorismate hydrolase
VAIPVIEPYTMPAEPELPANTARWTVDPARAMLLVHDMQNYFVRPFPADRAPMTDLVANIAHLRAWFAKFDAPVVYSAQPGGMTPAQRGLLRDFWGSGMTTDPDQRRILDGLAPGAADVTFTKWRPSAFCRTDLLRHMRALDRDQLVICGVYAHVGILMTAHEGFSEDIETFVVADAVADFTREHHRMAMAYAAARCSVVLTTASVQAMMDGAGR